MAAHHARRAAARLRADRSMAVMLALTARLLALAQGLHSGNGPRLRLRRSCSCRRAPRCSARAPCSQTSSAASRRSTACSRWRASSASRRATQTNATNSAAMYFTFDPFEERAKKHRTGEAILNEVRATLAPIQEAFVLVGGPPAVEGLGSGAGVKMMIQDRERPRLWRTRQRILRHDDGGRPDARASPTPSRSMKPRRRA